jgi:hypothetical protein
MINYFRNKLDLFVSTLAAAADIAQPKLAKRERLSSIHGYFMSIKVTQRRRQNPL